MARKLIIVDSTRQQNVCIFTIYDPTTQNLSNFTIKYVFMIDNTSFDTPLHQYLCIKYVFYTGFLLYRCPYLFTVKCQYIKLTNKIYCTSLAFKILPLKPCNDKISLLFVRLLKLPRTCSHVVYFPDGSSDYCIAGFT